MLKPGLQSQPRIFIVNIIRKKIKRWLKDMNLMFSWYDKYLTGLLRSLVWYCFCHSNKKFTYSRRRVIPLIFRPVEQKSPKRRPFILLSFILWRRAETERLNLEETLPIVRLKTYSLLIISMSFHKRIWRLVHTCEAKANANANRNASDLTHLRQTQENRDTQTQ